MNKENCALKLVDEIILYYDARSKKNIKFSSKDAVFSRITKGSLSHKYPSTRPASAAPGQDFPKILACRKFHILVRGTIFVVRVTDRNFRGIL